MRNGGVFMKQVKRIAFGTLLAAAAILAVLISKRISPDATALLLGVLAGFVASLPAGLLLIIWTSPKRPDKAPPSPTEPSPPIMVITGSDSPPTSPIWPQSPPPGHESDSVAWPAEEIASPNEQDFFLPHD